jgi:hypothetical protein
MCIIWTNKEFDAINARYNHEDAEYFSYVKDFKRIYALWDFLPDMLGTAFDFSS